MPEKRGGRAAVFPRRGVNPPPDPFRVGAWRVRAPPSVAKNAKCQVLGRDMPATYMPAGFLPRLGDLPYPPSEPRIP